MNEIDIRIAMRNEVGEAAEKAFGELAFLYREASDLNLHDPEDRAIFRGRVAERLKYTTVDAMREWVESTPMPSRAAAVRAVADAYIARAA